MDDPLRVLLSMHKTKSVYMYSLSVASNWQWQGIGVWKDHSTNNHAQITYCIWNGKISRNGRTRKSHRISIIKL